MSYRHYLWRNQKFDAKAFEAFLEDARKVLIKTKVMLKIGQMSGDALRFNGADMVGKDEKGEEFNFPRDYALNGAFPFRDAKNPERLFYSISTDKKPYDAVVVAVLLLAKIHFGDGVRILSDGMATGCNQAHNLLMETFAGRLTNMTISDGNDGLVVNHNFAFASSQNDKVFAPPVENKKAKAGKKSSEVEQKAGISDSEMEKLLLEAEAARQKANQEIFVKELEQSGDFIPEDVL